MSGDFTEINEFLVADLQALDLWDAEMLSDLKYYDGSIQAMDRIPHDLKQRYKTAFELEPEWLIRAASHRQKWIDMAQSLNLYVQEPNGRKLSELYLLAWRSGLKTTYYLRTLAATQIEKSTLDVNRYGLQPRWMKNESASNLIQIRRNDAATSETVCDVNDEDCEACQ
jgi:ribonucleoside-diphosphate reductase alpha chain